MKNNILYFLFFLPFMVQATIIIPPDNMAEMVNNSDLVVYCSITGNYSENPYQNSIKIIELIKGELQSYEQVIIDEYGERVGDWLNVVSGDTDFKIGKNYLVFLSRKDNGHYQARLMALSVFTEEKIDGQDVFVHDEGLRQISIVNNGTSISLEDMFSVGKFVTHLFDIAKNNATWNANSAGQLFIQAEPEIITDNPSPLVLGPCPNNKPSHCTVLAGDPNVLNSVCNTLSPGKYASNIWTAYIAGGAQSDPSTTTEITDVQNAITRLDGMPGINISDGGIDAGFGAAQIVCPGIGSSRLNFGGGFNDIYIFFDDPCSEITDLVGCSGTVGRGGHWTFSSCHTDICGNQWKNARYPYFYYNNGAGCVGADKYTAIAIHEMLHSMGVGHISGSCTAVMNPSICNSPAPTAPDYSVSSLDEDCTDWMYNITPALPVEVTGFSAELEKQSVLVNWSTVSELNNDFFQVERSVDNFKWEVIDKIKGAGNSTSLLDYETIDNNPFQNTSYYRLKQQDFDGSINYSDVVVIKNRIKESKVFISPNPFNEEFIINGYFENENTSLEVYDIKGELKYSLNITKGHQNIPVNIDNLNSGIYIVKMMGQKIQKTIKLVKL